MDTSDFLKEKVSELLTIVKELEERFHGKKFTLDGHLLGSIGEVLAQYYYGIEPYPNSNKTHDGHINGRNVQIKITQGTSVDIMDVPDYLLVLFLDKSDGNAFEVYNGPCEWLRECKRTKSGWYSRSLTSLSKMDENIKDNERIQAIKTIGKWTVGQKND